MRIMLLMSNTSAKREKSQPSFPPPRPAVFGAKPPAHEKATQRLSAGRSLRKAVLDAATACGGDEGLKGYLKFLASSDSASDRAAFASLLGKLLPRAVAVQAEVTTGVQVVLPWLDQSRDVDATPGDGVVIDQPTENIEENENV